MIYVLYQYELQHILRVHPFPLSLRKTALFDQPKNTNIEKQEEKFSRKCGISTDDILNRRGVRGVWRRIVCQMYNPKAELWNVVKVERRNGGKSAQILTE